MTKYEFVRKNLKLSADFNSYILENPGILYNIPESSCIVFNVKDDKEFSDKNIKIARKTKKKCLVATKEGNKWKVENFSSHKTL